MQSQPRITLESNGKIRPRRDRENDSLKGSGGREGIRTLETVPRLHTFQACAFDHSATRPGPGLAAKRGRMQGGNRAEFSRPAPGPLQAPRGLRKLRPHPKKRTAER